MFRFLFIFLFLISYQSKAQFDVYHSVYFDVDKYDIKSDEMNKLVKFVQSVDTSRVISINIYGFCDDRGKDDYNYILSENRAIIIKETLIKNNIQKKIFVKIEGKGRVLLESDTIKNIDEVRSKNRRVNILVKMSRFPKVFNWVEKDHVVNDRIYLLNIYFERGSDVLDAKSISELDRLVLDLKKFKKFNFEIQGHVCCTPLTHKDAVNRVTKERTLSVDRAKKVHDYLLKKGIDQKRMTFKGYGNTKPLEGAKDNFNRRVELLVTKVIE